MELVISAAEESVDYATSEVRAALGSEIRVVPVGRGVFGVTTGLGAKQAAEVVRASRPVFVRHQVPVGAVSPLTDGDDWTAPVVAQALELLASEGAPGLRTGVQIRDVALRQPAGEVSRRAALWRAVSAALPAAVSLDARHPERVLSVVLGEGTAWLGLAPVGLHLSAWAGGERHFAHRGDAASRAEYKLLEALESFELKVYAGARAADFGAAPGGWTKALAEAGLSVTAVDPALLDPKVLRLPRVTHARERAEVFIARSLAANDRFGLLVNDMRMDAREAATLMVRAGGLLAEGGRILTTLKLPKDGLRARLADARKVLEDSFELLALRQLFHNRAEVTALLGPR